jgi:hypothetical protein
MIRCRIDADDVLSVPGCVIHVWPLDEAVTTR